MLGITALVGWTLTHRPAQRHGVAGQPAAAPPEPGEPTTTTDAPFGRPVHKP
jgi:hypothetical protein